MDEIEQLKKLYKPLNIIDRELASLLSIAKQLDKKYEGYSLINKNAQKINNEIEKVKKKIMKKHQNLINV